MFRRITVGPEERLRTASERLALLDLSTLSIQFENTLAIGLRVLRISKKTLIETKVERASHGLMTGDSLHLGNMNRHPAPLQDIATYDGDFGHVPGLIVWEPMDVVL